MKLFVVVLLALATDLQAQSRPAYWGQKIDSTNDQSLPKTPYPISNQLFKVGFSLPLLRQASFTGFYKTLALNLLLERKLVGGLTLVTGLENNYGFNHLTKYYSLENPIDLRYYFSLGHRMKQRMDPHGFFSYYVALHTHNVIFSRLKYTRFPLSTELDRYYKGNLLRQPVNDGLITESFNYVRYAYLQLGMQRRIFKQSFFDVNVVLPASFLIYHRWDYTLSSPAYVNLSFGRYFLSK